MTLAYAPDALIRDPDDESCRLRPDFDPARHRLRIDFGGTPGRGGAGADWADPADPQVARVCDHHGRQICAGHALLTRRFALACPGGVDIRVDVFEIGGTPVAHVADAELVPGRRYAVEAEDRSPGGEVGPTLSGFAPGAMVATPRGETPVERLVPGDGVFTRDHGVQRLRWAGRVACGAVALAACDLLPRDAAARPLRAAPGTGVLVTGAGLSLHFGLGAALARIVDLAEGSAAAGPGVHALLLEEHELLRVNGHWCESLFLDRSAAALFASHGPPPDIRHRRAAAPCLAGWEARLLRDLAGRSRATGSRSAA